LPVKLYRIPSTPSPLSPKRGEGSKVTKMWVRMRLAPQAQLTLNRENQRDSFLFRGCNWRRLLSPLSFTVLQILLSGCLLTTIGCDIPKNGAVKTTLTRSDLFRLHCSGCHGDGSGNGHIASTLAVRPRNLRQIEWQASVTDSHILQVIRNGGIKYKLSDKMPGFADKLTDQQVQSLVEYIRLLKE